MTSDKRDNMQFYQQYYLFTISSSIRKRKKINITFGLIIVHERTRTLVKQKDFSTEQSNLLLCLQYLIRDKIFLQNYAKTVCVFVSILERFINVNMCRQNRAVFAWTKKPLVRSVQSNEIVALKRVHLHMKSPSDDGVPNNIIR